MILDGISLLDDDDDDGEGDGDLEGDGDCLFHP
jgi:hypothetical protein